MHIPYPTTTPSTACLHCPTFFLFKPTYPIALEKSLREDTQKSWENQKISFFALYQLHKKEVAMEVEDDLFFADLSKQISLLIMDEEEEEEDDPVANFPVSLQDFSRAIHPPERLPPILYVQTCRRESKGTGVFIPQSSRPRRKKHRQGRFASYNAISRRKPDTTGMTVSQASSNHSFRPKKG